MELVPSYPKVGLAEFWEVLSCLWMFLGSFEDLDLFKNVSLCSSFARSKTQVRPTAARWRSEADGCRGHLRLSTFALHGFLRCLWKEMGENTG